MKKLGCVVATFLLLGHAFPFDQVIGQFYESVWFEEHRAVLEHPCPSILIFNLTAQVPGTRNRQV